MGGTPWHYQEDKTLMKMWPLAPLSEIHSALPGRSRHAINNRASAVLKLYRFPEARRHAGKAPRNLASVIIALRRAREDQGITQMRLANKIGVPKATLQKWENGNNGPRFRMLVDWAQTLGYEVSIRLKDFRRSNSARSSSPATGEG